MTSVCFYFQVHQPIRLRKLHGKPTSPALEVPPGKMEAFYFDGDENRTIFEKVARKCYLPTNALLLELLERHREDRPFKVAFSLSGVFIDQCRAYSPEVLDSFRRLAKTGRVEFLGETYYHSLASLFSEEEFAAQVKEHSRAVESLFGRKPRVFRNTELIYNDRIAALAGDLGFKAILTEGIERILDGWRSPNYVYRPASSPRLALLTKNYRLSDDIAFRFSARWWSEHPLTADKYARWLASQEGPTVNLFMDYETFGEHQWADTGIFDFLRALPAEVLKHRHLDFATPSEVAERNEPVGAIGVDPARTISWADQERDTSAWLGNQMQQVAFHELGALEKPVRQLDNPGITRVWRLLQESDHLYYMSTKGWDFGHGPDGDVHNYFSHYGNPLHAAMNYLMVLSDFKTRLMGEVARREPTAERRRKAKLRMLFALREHGRPYAEEVAAETGLPEKEATSCLKELEARGYVARNSLTPTGRALVGGLVTQVRDRAFHFHLPDGRYAGCSAHSLEEFAEAAGEVNLASLEFHGRRGDFEGWARWVLEDGELGDRLRAAPGGGDSLRTFLRRTVESRKRELQAGLD